MSGHLTSDDDMDSREGYGYAMRPSSPTVGHKQSLSARLTEHEISNSSQPLKKKRKVVSAAWSEFDLIVDGNDRYGKCKHCNSLIKATNGTTGLFSHIDACKTLKVMRQNEDFQLGNNPSAQYSKREKGRHSVNELSNTNHEFNAQKDANIIMKHVANMVIRDGISFTTAESAEFRNMLSYLYPSFPLIRASDIIEECMALRKGTANHIRDLLHTARSRISFTIEIQTTLTGIDYVVINAHFFTSSWKLVSTTLSCKRLQTLSGRDIFDIFDATMKDWDIGNRIMAVTTAPSAESNSFVEILRSSSYSQHLIDLSGSYESKEKSKISKLLDSRCFTMIIHQIAEKAIESVQVPLQKLRDTIGSILTGSYYSNPSMEGAGLDQSMHHGWNQEEFAKYCHESNIPLELPFDAPLSTPILDIPQIWTSTYEMLMNSKPYFMAYAAISQAADSRISLQESDMDDLKDLLRFLEPLYETVKEFSMSTRHTLDYSLMRLQNLKKFIETFTSQEGTGADETAGIIQTKSSAQTDSIPTALHTTIRNDITKLFNSYFHMDENEEDANSAMYKSKDHSSDFQGAKSIKDFKESGTQKDKATTTSKSKSKASTNASKASNDDDAKNGEISHEWILYYIGTILNPKYKLLYLDFLYRDDVKVSRIRDHVLTIYVNNYVSYNLPEDAEKEITSGRKFNQETTESAVAVGTKNTKKKSKVNEIESGPNIVSNADDKDFISYATLEQEKRRRKEFDKYMNESLDPHCDVAEYWSTHSAEYPALSQMALDFLTVQLSSYNQLGSMLDRSKMFNCGASHFAGSGRAAGRILDEYYSHMTPQLFEVMMQLKSWMRVDAEEEYNQEAHEIV